MAFSHALAERVEAELAGRALQAETANFMSGKGFFVEGGMVVAVVDESLCLEVDDDDLTAQHGVRPFQFAGRPVPGWICVAGAELGDLDLAKWIEVGLSGMGRSER